MAYITDIDILEINGVPNVLICPGILMGNIMTSQKLKKGWNEPANMLITFMVSILKNYRFESVFSGNRGNLPLKLSMTVIL